MATNSSYDTLSIKIEADSSSAQSSVAKLTNGLTNLENVAKNLDLDAFKKVQKILQDISKIDFSNVSKGLDSVAKSFQTIAKSSSRRIKNGLTGGLTEVQPQVDEPNFTLLGGSYGKDFQMFQQELVKVNNELAIFKGFIPDFSYFTELMKEMHFNHDFFEQSAEINKNIQDIIGGAYTLDGAFSQLNTETKNVETNWTTVTGAWYNSLSPLERLKYELQQVAKSLGGLVGGKIDGAVDGFKKLAIQFTRIARYRIIRKIIQEIYKGLVEGLNRMALFDEKTNMAISNIKASFSNLTSSLGTVIAPILTALEPILTTLIDLVAKLFNSLGNLFSALQGGAIIKSQKQWEDYAKTLKKTTSISIDELNIIGEQQKTFYIEVEGLEKVSQLADSLSNIALLVSGIVLAFGVDWKKAIKTVGEMIGALSTKIKSLNFDVKGLGVALLGVTTTVSSFVSIMANGLDWNNLITMIGGVTVAVIGLQKAFHKLNVTLASGVIAGLLMVVTAVVDIIQNGVNAQNVILAIIGALAGAVTGFYLLLQTKTYSAIIALKGLKASVVSVGVALGTLTAGVMLFVTAFDKVKASWGQANFWQKLAMVIGLVLVAVSSLVAVVSAFTHQWHIFAVGVAGMAVGAGLSIGVATSVPQFAEGGFPEDGLFMANHGELVGQFSNGRTAVANNEQITEGIYQAVRDAMRDSGNGNIVIEMDGYKVAQGVTKRQNNMESIIRGGNLVYGK